MISKKTKNYHKPIIAALIGGVAIMPIQNAFSHNSIDVTVSDISAKILSEQHTPHQIGHHLNDYYVDPRSIRAIGQDTGKSDQRGRNGRENWDTYTQRML